MKTNNSKIKIKIFKIKWIILNKKDLKFLYKMNNTKSKLKIYKKKLKIWRSLIKIKVVSTLNKIKDYNLKKCF